MPAEPEPIRRKPPPILALRLRQIGLLVLVVGLATAVLVAYLDLVNPANSEENSLLNGDYKTEYAEMQRLWGNFGPVLFHLREDFRYAERGIFIAVLSVLVAFACFFFAHRLARSSRNLPDSSLIA